MRWLPRVTQPLQRQPGWGDLEFLRRRTDSGHRDGDRSARARRHTYASSQQVRSQWALEQNSSRAVEHLQLAMVHVARYVSVSGHDDGAAAGLQVVRHPIDAVAVARKHRSKS